MPPPLEHRVTRRLQGAYGGVFGEFGRFSQSHPHFPESDKTSPTPSENGMKRALKRLLGLCMADSALCFFLSGLYMARAPRYPRYGRCNSAPRTRHITFQVPYISHLAFPRPMNLPYIGEITSRQPLLRPAQHNRNHKRNPNIRQSHHTRPTSAPYHTTITHIPRKHSEKMPPLFKPHSTKPVGSRTTLLPEATTDGHRRQPAVPTTDAPTIAGASASSHRPQATSRHNPATQNNNKTTSTTPNNRRRQQRQHPGHAEPHPM